MCIHKLQPTDLIAGTFLNPLQVAPLQKKKKEKKRVNKNQSHRAWHKTHSPREKKKRQIFKNAELMIASVVDV